MKPVRYHVLVSVDITEKWQEQALMEETPGYDSLEATLQQMCQDLVDNHIGDIADMTDGCPDCHDGSCPECKDSQKYLEDPVLDIYVNRDVSRIIAEIKALTPEERTQVLKSINLTDEA